MCIHFQQHWCMSTKECTVHTQFSFNGLSFQSNYRLTGRKENLQVLGITGGFSTHWMSILPPNNVTMRTQSHDSSHINKNSSGDEIANVNFLTTISHTRRPTSKYRKRENLLRLTNQTIDRQVLRMKSWILASATKFPPRSYIIYRWRRAVPLQTYTTRQ